MQWEAIRDLTAIGEEVTETIVNQPELLIALLAIATAIVLATVAWWYLRRTPARQFLIELAEKDRIAVLMHPNPDPDAMASAMGVAALAHSVDTAASVRYPGQIRHPENRAFETVLDCEFTRIERREDLDAETVVLVDHNEPRGFEGAAEIEPYAVIDHHPGNGQGRAFTDVRTDRGSCASILTDYFRDREWSNDIDYDGRSLPPSLATALLYGIQSDTTSFTRSCTDAEFDAAAYLFPAADPDSLDRIANPQVDSETLDVKARAISKRTVKGPFLVSHVGTVSNLDAIPVSAEELLRLEGITTAVVTGERDGTLHVSGRSRDDRVHMGKAISTALEIIPDASAGGHARMGGGQAALSGPADRNGHRKLQDRFFAAMNGEL